MKTTRMNSKTELDSALIKAVLKWHSLIIGSSRRTYIEDERFCHDALCDAVKVYLMQGGGLKRKRP